MAGDNAAGPEPSSAESVVDDAWLRAVSTEDDSDNDFLNQDASNSGQEESGKDTSTKRVLVVEPSETAGRVVFDAREYSLVDLQWVVDLWILLISCGRTLTIVLEDGSEIALQNFFAPSTVSDRKSAAGTVVKISESKSLSASEFAEKFPVTTSCSSETTGAGGADGGGGGGGGAGSLDVFVSRGSSLVLPIGSDVGLLSPTVVNSAAAPSTGLGTVLPPLPGFILPGFPLLPPDPGIPPAPANVPPVIDTAVSSGGTIEDIPPPAASGTIDFGDADLGDTHTVSVAPAAGGYVGSFTASLSDDSTGDGTGQVVWNFSVDNAALQFLAQDQQLTQVYAVTIDDGRGGTDVQNVTITITGTNDVPIITAVIDQGEVTEGELPLMIAAGDIDFGDVDLADAHIVSVTPSAGGYLGVFSASVTDVATGDGSGEVGWLFVADNALRQALGVDQILIQTYTVVIDDGQGGTTSQIVTITINGTNDAAVITGDSDGLVIEAGGIANGTLGVPTDSGDLDSTDADDVDDLWEAVATPTATTGGYGTYQVTSNGVWTYTLDDNNAVVQALNIGGTLPDTFTVFTIDGTAQVVSIAINGANDTALISGPSTGVVLEAGAAGPGTPVAAGDLLATDVDNTPDLWQAVSAPTAGTNGYGTFTLTAAGLWTYTLDNANAAVDALNIGGILSDMFTVLTADGTSQLVTVTINGANDAAIVTGDNTGSVVEAGGVANGTPGTPTDSGNLDSTDVDNTGDAWQAIVAPTASTGGYGTYQLASDGVWIYTLDDNNAAVQALNAGVTLVDTFTAFTIDGTAHLVSITITGANDAPAAVADDNAGDAVTESGVNPGNTPFPGDPSATGNVLANDTDVDAGESKIVTEVNGSC